MTSATLHSPSAADETTFSCGPLSLHALRVRPIHPAWARLQIIHGYGEHAGRYLAFMRWMAERGVVCEAIDLRGHGRSPGPRGFVSRWERYLDDVKAFLEAPGLREDQALPRFVLGHSHGGLIAAAAAEQGLLASAGVTGCILCSPYLATRLPNSLGRRLLAVVANVLWPRLKVATGLQWQWLTSDREMVDESRTDALLSRTATPRWYRTMLAARRRVVAQAREFTLPLLCLAGESDIVADPAATADFFRRAGSADKSLYVYPNHVHELLRETGREKIFADILKWVEARVGRGSAE
jgi:alpha-beta hydrolase superfamily lysophospholipase